MQRLSRAAGIVAWLISSSVCLAQSTAAGSPPSWKFFESGDLYLRNEIGGNLVPDLDSGLSLDAGVAWNLALGWQFTDFLSVEATSGVTYNTFDSLAGSPIDGSLLQVPVLGQVRFEVPLASYVNFVVGGGAGVMYIDASSSSIPSSANWEFAYTATGGLEFPVGTGGAFGVFYRFLGTSDTSFASSGIFNQQIVASFTLRF